MQVNMIMGWLTFLKNVEYVGKTAQRDMKYVNTSH